MLHERVSAVAELGLFALALAHELGFIVSGRFVRVIGAPLATEVHHPARAISGRGRPILRLEALEARPRFNERAVDCEMLIGEQIRRARGAYHRIEETPGGVLLDHALAQAREVRLVQPGLLQIHVQKPAEQDVVIEHFAKHPVRAHRVKRDQQTRLEQALRRNRRPAAIGIQSIELARHRREHRVGLGLDRAQRMLGRHPRFGREVSEHRSLGINVSAHSDCFLHETVVILEHMLNGQSKGFASSC